MPSYSVESQGQDYIIYSPDLEDSEGQCWGRATFAFFDIVNKQLEGSTHRFYAFYGGNDLGGMFLKKEEYDAAIKSYKNKKDWPYLPED